MYLSILYKYILTPPKRNIENANECTKYLGMCFPLEGEKSGGSAPKSFKTLTRVSLTES